MVGLSTGLKKKLTISPYTIESNGSLNVNQSEKFEVMLNPSGYTQQRSISYNKKKALGKSGSDPEFFAVDTEKISFDIVIDGTGVVNLPIPGVGSPDVKTQVQQLNDIIYKYDGENHEPNRVRLLWGSLIFYGRLESSTVEYTLFKPSGEPLRAKIKLSFTSAMTSKEEALAAKRSSPDLTHILEVKEGDTLPLLCYRVYKDCSYYPQVAKENNLIDFRHIKPGTKLYFPPLR